MKIRNVRSGIRNAPDEEPPQPLRARIAYWVYVLILLSIVGAAVWYGVREYMHFEGEGQVRVDRTLMSAPRDGRIEAILPAVGDSVQAGDPLFRVDPGAAAACDPDDQSDLRDLRSQLESDRLRLQQAQNRRTRVQAELQDLRERVALELNASTARREQLRDEAFRLQQQIERLRQRLRLNRRELQTLSATSTADPECVPYTVSAPRSGRVHRVLQPPQTFVEEGTSILSLAPTPASAFVYAYLDTDLARYLRRGDTLSVSLPDGTKSRGVVQRLYSSALEFAQLKYDGYQALPSELLARVAPIGVPTDRHWRAFDRMDVEVTGQIAPSRLFASRSSAEQSSAARAPDTTESVAPPDTASRAWALVAASFAAPKRAQSAAHSFDERLPASLPVQVRPAPVRDTTRHRVLIGRFPTRKQARTAHQTYDLPAGTWPLQISAASRRSSPSQ